MRVRLRLAVASRLLFCGLIPVTAVSLPAQTLTTLYSFSSGYPSTSDEGQQPSGVLQQAPNGLFYGVTFSSPNNCGTVYSVSSKGAPALVYEFNGSDGSGPMGALYIDLSGDLYGTTNSGGANGDGCVYEISSTGNFSTVHSFSGGASDGQNPTAGLLFVKGQSGNPDKFFGVTPSGGGNNCGVLFSMSTDGSNYTILHTFGGTVSGYPDGKNPQSGLTLGSDGLIYGTCYNGGPSFGTVFSIHPDGSGYDQSGPQGQMLSSPLGRLVEASPGHFYGCCIGGGSHGFGLIFAFTHVGGAYSIADAWDFDGAGGANPECRLALLNGGLYGVTGSGGPYGWGVAFEFAPSSGAYTVLHSFDLTDGWFSGGGPSVLDGATGFTRGTDKNLYGASNLGGLTAVYGSLGFGVFMAMKSTGAVTPEMYFSTADINTPYEGASVVQGPDGAFYGHCFYGGAFGGGALYRCDNTGNMSIVHYFSGGPVATGFEGLSPTGTPVVGKDGALYGCTLYGGNYNAGGFYRCTTTGQLTMLHSFSDGAGTWPNTPVQNVDGNFYGTLYAGGPDNEGAVYKLTPKGVYATIHYFSAAEGFHPSGALTTDSAGNLYGVSESSGAYGAGSLWKLTSQGEVTILHAFNPADGEGDEALTGPLVAPDGNLYGVTEIGGAHNFGTVYRYSPANASFSVIYAFAGGSGDGAYPYYSVPSWGEDGNLYVTTFSGGAYGYGAVCRVGPSGSGDALVYSFTGSNPQPQCPVVIGSDGNLYGTTFGPSTGSGTLWQLDTGLANAVDISAQVTATVTASSATKYSITIKNNGPAVILGPLQVVIRGAAAGVSLTNGTGDVPAGYSTAGDPYVTVLSSPIGAIKKGASMKVLASFSGSPGTFSVETYTGRF